jgi:diaminohydroxyphosphoribosylaminopyrimidine deaminase / 5-amino-6-(5-phosphoribosylamino)uracil reductase
VPINAPHQNENQSRLMTMFSAADGAHMRRALALGEANMAIARPNPSVGCVLVARNGEIIAEGATDIYGADHAEQVTLKKAGERARGATMVVTLEPCNHVSATSGRRESCCESIIRAGVARVVIGTTDTNPRINGAGITQLNAAGVAVAVGCLEAEARALHIGFLTRITRATPWVRAKMAASLDGRTALANGVSQWITAEAARADGHAFRARACAVLAGAGTLRVDNPRLTVRHVPVTKQPLRVLLDAKNTLTADMNVFQDVSDEAPVLHVTATPRAPIAPNVQTLALGDASHRIDLSALLRALGERKINELHLEAGARLTGAFIEQNLVDELLIYLAPKLIGPQGKEMFTLPALEMLPRAQAWAFSDLKMIGDDVRLRLLKKR